MSNHHTDAEHGFSVDNDRDELAPSSRTHWAHPTEHVPACIVEGTIVIRNEVCSATADVADVTCEECRTLLPAAAATDAWHQAAWMQTFTGRAFRPFNATVDDIDCADIARSLSMQCRYNGHVNRFYSVAEHAVLMSETFEDRNLALWALLHDGAEAYIGDMVRPLKITDSMKPFRELDARLTALIAEKWDLVGRVIPPEVKAADNQILLDERAELLGAPAEPWVQDTDGSAGLGVTIKGWYPPVAELNFLRRLDELDGAGW